LSTLTCDTIGGLANARLADLGDLVADGPDLRTRPGFVVSSGGHFALDLGLDRENPAACLDALTDGVEQRIDLGIIGDRTFVNNASFGAYAEVVRSPAYRDDKRGTTLQILPDLLTGHTGPTLAVRAGAITVTGPQAVLVSNNAYEMSDIAGLGHRARLDAEMLGIVVVTVNSAMRAVGLLGGGGVMVLTADEAVVDADVPEIPVGIDGETVMVPTPVRCAIRPRTLRAGCQGTAPGSARPSPGSTRRRCGHWPRPAPRPQPPNPRKCPSDLPSVERPTRLMDRDRCG
jgi:hypothetical protein